MEKFQFQRVRSLLRKPADDPAVIDLIARDPSEIERSAYYGFVEFKRAGVSVMFKEGQRVVPLRELRDPQTLYVAAFHFHAQNHEGYAGYQGDLPNGVALGDSENEIVSKLGPPSATGGGGVSSVLKKSIAYWLRYSLDDAVLQFQLDDHRRVEMVTFYSPDLKSGTDN